jgi:four helix bundle protein
MKGYTYAFEKLDVWHLAKNLTVKVYKLTAKFPSDEKFGITMQMRRACVSICSNTAEGSGRRSNKDKARFIEIAYGSALELLSDLLVSLDLEFSSLSDVKNLRPDIEEVTNKLNSLRNSYI